MLEVQTQVSAGSGGSLLDELQSFPAASDGSALPVGSKWPSRIPDPRLPEAVRVDQTSGHQTSTQR
jgi:hypothetical protein